MVAADLHVHTPNSDGRLALADVPAAARRAGVDVVAITDHDRPHPDLEGPVVERDGVSIVHGIELRVASDAGRVDLLGFGLERTPALEDLCERLQRDRVARARAMVETLEAHLGVSLPVALEPGVGRPDVARTVAAVTDYEVQAVFDELIGDDRPFYVPRDVPAFERGRAVLADAATLIGLAHPLRYEDPEGALALCATLDAVEREYPYEAAVDLDGGLATVDATIERHDLLPTGGSDAHDDRLGLAGLDRPAADRFLRAVNGGSV